MTLGRAKFFGIKRGAWREIGAGAALLILLAFLYHRTALPGAGGGDTAKFQLVGPVLGTPHSTGYPLYVLLSWLWSALRGDLEWARAANLLTVGCTAAAALAVWRALRESGCSATSSLLASAAFGLAPGVWQQAGLAEVYPLHLALLALVTWAAARYHRTGTRGALYALAVLVGLALGHHRTAVLFLPALAAFLLADGRRLSAGAFARAVALALTALIIPYAYIVWRSYAPEVGYLEMRGDSLPLLLFNLTGAQARWNVFQSPVAELVGQRLPWVAATLWGQLGGLALLAAFGARHLEKAWRRFVWLGLAGVAAFPFGYWVPDAHAYLVPAAIPAAMAAAAGFERLRRPLRSSIIVILLGISTAWNPLASRLRLAQVNHLAEDAFRKRNEALIAALPPQALLLSFEYDTTLGLEYLRQRDARRGLHLIGLPAQSLRLPFGLAPYRRYLEGSSFQYGPHDRLVPPGLPVFVYLPIENPAAALAAAGVRTRVLPGSELLLAEASPQSGAPLPVAVLATTLIEHGGTLHSAAAVVAATGFDPHATVLRLTGGRFGRRELSPGGRVLGTHVEPNRWRIEVDSPGGGWLVLSDSFQDRWEIEVDGLPTTAFRADLLFLGIPVGAGHRSVELRRSGSDFSLRRWLSGGWPYQILAR